MKQVVTNYSFSTSAKTVTLSDFNSSYPVDLKRLYLITDVTINTILFNFADSTVASATISSNNVITLSAVPGGAANGDSLQIVYEAKSTDPIYETPLLPSNAAQETGGNLATIAGAISSARLNVNDVFAQPVASSAAWTSATSNNTALTVSSLSGYGTIIVSFVASGTLTAGGVNFEAYDGTNWWPAPMQRGNTFTLETTYTLTGANQIWYGDIAGFQQYRVRLNPVITGSGTANIIINAMAADNVVNVIVGQANAAKLLTTTWLNDGSGNAINSTSSALNTYLTNTSVGITNPLVSTPQVGQSKIAGTGTAVQLNGGTSQVLTNGIIISASSANVASISVGGSGVNNTTGGTGNGYLLPPGASISFAMVNTNDLYINGTAGDYVSWAGS
ncbi:MAG TPA: hypothetical protein VMR34_01175 [Candidatus Saccharimonadales bacterium]|nr:hypothetical protein [Candidatus Saccharimonadales bacterium]